ncbi:MAG TPA: ORF6N domain-containing protein [Gemmatimonadales bacterium]|nr:ORF6N domain-containing protein [Gemmatimonadales bacterium]
MSLRGVRVVLSPDLARLYGVPVKALMQAVGRNRVRFPRDFLFQLTATEVGNLRSQSVTSSWGGRRVRPYAFTEQGVAMLSSVLRSPRAIAVNIAIMRAFVRLRSILASHADLARRLEDLERRYDGKFRMVFQAIRELMNTPEEAEEARPRIGFHARGGRALARGRLATGPVR